MKEVPCPDCDGKGFIAKFGEYSVWSERCQNCGGTRIVKVPVTNADHIRAMSDEELAILLCRIMGCSICKRNIQKDGECDNYSADGLSKAVLNWLQRPVEEDT